MGRRRPTGHGGLRLPKHIGIVAASPEGSSFCYRRIGRRASEIQDPEQRPLVTLHNRPFSSYVEALRHGDWRAIADLLADSARVLSRAGADFCVLPDNALHHAVPLAESDSPIPWLSMIDLVADAVQSNGCSAVGLIGTKFVTNGSTYQTALGLRGMRLHVPEEATVDAIDRVIFSEAIFGRVRSPSRRLVHDAIGALKERGCDAVILGCSEASLMLAVEESPLPVVDPVELLAEASVRHAMTGAGVPG